MKALKEVLFLILWYVRKCAWGAVVFKRVIFLASGRCQKMSEEVRRGCQKLSEDVRSHSTWYFFGFWRMSEDVRRFQML